ncbi:unnamed protein product [Fusarium graminearum]|nr:unnamed protein product [Fusarium graminearum]
MDVWHVLTCPFTSDIEGADKQDLILPQDKNAKFVYRRHYSLDKNTVDGRLSYAEFMADLEAKLTPLDMDYSLQAPNSEGIVPGKDGQASGKPSVAEAVETLKLKGWAQTMKVDQVTSGKTKDYGELVGRVDKKFQDYYDKLGSDPKWKRKLIETNQRTNKLTGEIVALRQQEADDWVIKQLTQDADHNNPKVPDEDKKLGIGLSRDDLVIERVRSSIPGATTYERVDLVRTFLEHPNQAEFLEKLSTAGIKGGIQGLINWADMLGNERYANWGAGFTDANKSHHQAKSLWLAMHDSSTKRLGGLSPSCSR